MKWLLARRYLFSRKSHSVINIIAGVSLVAVAVPVAAMIILLSVFNGFETLVRQMYAAVDADIEIRAAAGCTPELLRGTDAERAEVMAVDGVDAVSFVVERQALLEHGDRQATAMVRGVDDSYGDVVPIAGHVTLGNADVRLGDLDRILMGEALAYSLGIYSTVGGDAALFAPGGGRVGSLLPATGFRELRLPLCGMFSIDNENDSGLAIIPLRAAHTLFTTGGRADAAMVRVKEGHSPERVRQRLEEVAGEGAEVLTREEKNSVFYSIMRYEKWGVFFISALVLVIASFSITGTVIMLIVEKRGERVTLRSMGADNAFIRGIFVREGMLISGIGGIAGLVVGIALTLMQQHLHIISMPAGNFLVSSYPAELQLADIAAVTVTFMAVTWAVSRATAQLMIKPDNKCDAH